MQFAGVLQIVFAVLLALTQAANSVEPPRSIPRTAVESSNLKSIGYDAASKTLEVEFNEGGVYRYFDVPRATHQGLIKSESKGKFFHGNIRGKFRFQRCKEAS